MLNNSEYIQVRTEDEDIWADYWLSPTSNGIEAQGMLFGPGKGDVIMRKVIEELTKEANRLGEPITHCFVASNKGAVALIQRTEGYSFSGKTVNNHPMYTRIYNP
jgi:hypothetical protein